MFISFSNGNGSAFENSLDSGRISFRKRPWTMYMHKDNAVGNVVAETGRDLIFGTTARLSDLSKPLTGEVWRSPEPSACPSAAAEKWGAANLYDVLTFLLTSFASTKFCEFGIVTILRVLIFAISWSRGKFCDFAQQKVNAQRWNPLA